MGLVRRSRAAWTLAAAALASSVLVAPPALAAMPNGLPATSIVEPIGDVWAQSLHHAEPEVVAPPDPETPPQPTPSEAPQLPVFTGPEFNELFSTAALPNLAQVYSPPSLTDSEEINQRVLEHAEERGYVRRPLPKSFALMRLVEEGQALQRPAASAWFALAADAAAHGFRLDLRSAYRGPAYQREVFLRPLSEPYEFDELAERLKLSAPPGYSKHHTGYAIDIAQDGYPEFGRSPAYAWLAGNNFAHAKKHGWIPSYPPDGGLQGPVPEPWEFTYVGRRAILCFHQLPLDDNPLCRD